MINEGKFKTVKATNALRYEKIYSCLTVIYAYDTGVPEGEQLNLTQMLHLLSGMDQATIFYILGCIDIWNINYFGSSGLNISFTINGQLVNSVGSIVPAPGYDASSNAVLLVTSNNGSVTICSLQSSKVENCTGN